MLANYHNAPNSLNQAIADPNTERKAFIAYSVGRNNPTRVGVYRWVMTVGGDNFRASAIQGGMKRVKARKGTR